MLTGTNAAEPIDLSVSIVVYQSNPEWLQQTLQHLAVAVLQAKGEGRLGRACLRLIDNDCDRFNYRHCVQGDSVANEVVADEAAVAVMDAIEWHFPGRNLGYGGGHNVAIEMAQSDWHLILNPDASLAPDALVNAITHMVDHPDVLLWAPQSVNGAGCFEYLAKSYPTMLDLAVRGFAPGFVKHWFDRRLARYERRDLMSCKQLVTDVEIASGCCMLVKTRDLQAVQGFDDSFFLYFEDFDLSLRLRERGLLGYLPSMNITHYGGGAAKKGAGHIRMFVVSAGRFFHKHGWRFW